MAVGTHSLLSPSSASRWLVCTPSAKMQLKYPSSTNPASEEGTIAHLLSEVRISQALGLEYNSDDETVVLLSSYYSEEMETIVEEYVNFVVGQFEMAKAEDPLATITLELKVDLSEFTVKGTAGTTDVNITSNKVLRITDLKYGRGTYVSAYDNDQLKLYALGVLRKYELYNDFEKVVLTIYQPRMNNVQSFEISVSELLAWGKDVVKPASLLASEGKGEAVAGNHCKYCKAQPECKKFKEYALANRPDPNIISDDEMEEVLDKAELVTKYFEAVKKFALEAVIKGKRRLPSYEIGLTSKHRQITDIEGLKAKAKELGIEEQDLMTTELKKVTELEKILGKKELASYIAKPKGEQKLIKKQFKL